MLPSCRNLANPKSAIFRVMLAGDGRLLPQLCESKIFCGFRSLWTMPFAKSAFIAPAESEDIEQGERKFLMQQSYPIEWEIVWWCLRSKFLWQWDSQRDHLHCSIPSRDRHCVGTPYSRVEPPRSHGAVLSALWVFWFPCPEDFVISPSSS